MQVNLNPQTTFGTKRQFKKLFRVCAYSGEPFESYDTKTVEHIIPKIKIRSNEKYNKSLIHDLKNKIIIKKSWNERRSNKPLKEFMELFPQVRENIKKTVKGLEGKIIDGINWAEEVKQTFFEEIGEDIFK